MRSIWFLLFALLLCNHDQEKSAVCGFNLDLSNYIRHAGPERSMFGFSVTLYRSTVNFVTNNWVIAGAPKLRVSHFYNVDEPGGVFRCDILADNRCSEMQFDTKSGNNINDRGEQIDTKARQWMGATVTSGGIDGPLLACAPRYVFHTMQPNKQQRIEPVGTCFSGRYVSNNSFVVTEYSPCRTNYFGYHRQGFCQAGFSAAVTKNSERIFVGAPGSWYWQGQVYSINSASQFPYKPHMYHEFGSGQVHSIGVDVVKHSEKLKVYTTSESPPSYDDSYFGYSVATGDFTGDGVEGAAVGMPRGANLLGKVALYTWNMQNLLNITGKQIGAYFGYSLCTVDVDGDKLDDLVIGAPMHTESNNEGKYDVGRVYVMLQGATNKFSHVEIRDGMKSKGRFGLSVASLGDVNLDGYGDFAVGAPYDGPHGRGAVYIFYGSATGPLPKHSQVIYAENLERPYPHTFGFSLAGGLDLDSNLYPDMAAGAYDSDMIFVFRARPVAVVDATTKFSSSSKLVSLDDKRCTTYRDGKAVTCTEIKSCMKYDGINLPGNLIFDVSWVLDIKKMKNPRMFFLSDEGKNVRNSTFSLERGNYYCYNETVYIVEGIVDKLTPLEVEMRYQLISDRNRAAQEHLVRRPRDIPLPVIDQNRETIQRDSINIQKNCGPDNICIPNLRLEVETVEKFLLGSKEPLVIDVLITNFGEDAFETVFYMLMPEDLNYKRIKQIGDARDLPITCSAPESNNNFTLKCDIGNPLPAGKVAKFKVFLMPSQKSGMSPSYDFYWEVNSTNPEEPGSEFDNKIKRSIGIWVKSDLSVEGTSLPPSDYYNVNAYKSLENATTENDVGPHVVHIYNIRNNGPSIIEQTEVYIVWPYETHGGDQLMYLLNAPETEGNIHCDPNVYVNERNLILDPTYSKKSYLEQIGARVVTAGGTAKLHNDVHIQHPTLPHQFIPTRGTTARPLSEEEIHKLEAEETKESKGDASREHERRYEEAHKSQGSGTVSESGSRSGSTQIFNWYHNNSSNIPKRKEKNVTITYDSDGNRRVIESSTEYYIDSQNNNPYYNRNTNIESGAGYTQDIHRSNNNRESSYHSQSNDMGARSGQAYDSYNYQQNRGGNTRDGYHQGNGGNVASRHYTTNYRDYPTASTNFEKVAQGGQGFQTGSIDLGTINRGNVDDELRNRNMQQSYSGGSGRTVSTDYTQHSAGYPSHSSGYRTSESSHHVNPSSHQSYQQQRYVYPSTIVNREKSLNTNNHFDEQDEDDEEFYDEEGDLDYPSLVAEDNKHQRLRRQTISGDPDKDIEEAVHCKATRCAMLHCFTGPLQSNDGVWIAIRTRLVAHTMAKLSLTLPLNISTMAVARVTLLPYIGKPAERPIKSHEIFYAATPEPKTKEDLVPLWVVVLSAVVGAIILLLLIFLLYKCGFFKRNRPSDSSERQPLSRNGNYHGDEHL